MKTKMMFGNFLDNFFDNFSPIGDPNKRKRTTIHINNNKKTKL